MVSLFINGKEASKQINITNAPMHSNGIPHLLLHGTSSCAVRTAPHVLRCSSYCCKQSSCSSSNSRATSRNHVNTSAFTCSLSSQSLSVSTHTRNDHSDEERPELRFTPSSASLTDLYFNVNELWNCHSLYI